MKPPLRFENPMNGHVEEVDGAWFWTLLFGCFYLGYKGAWGAAVLAFFAALFTAGLAWLVMPVFADDMIRKSFLGRGWKELPAEGKAEPAAKPKRSAAQEAEHRRKLQEAAKRTFGR